MTEAVIELTHDEAVVAIDARLKELFIDFDIRHVGVLPCFPGSERSERKAPVDSWTYTFTKYKTRLQDFYYTGMGLRKAYVVKTDAKGVRTKVERRMPADCRGNSIWASRQRAAWEAEYMKPHAPKAADVLYSLVLDAVASEESLQDWCDNFGYNPDSIKDVAMYNRCAESGRELTQMFGRKEVIWLRDAFQNF